MPRLARSVIEGLPYHVTQRGNRGEDVFFCDGDRRRYLAWLRDYSERYGLDILAYCLMTNHVHLVVVPRSPDAMSRTLHAVNTRHSQSVNAEREWTGHLWQGRYFSAPLDEAHLWSAVRYVERNPVRAAIVSRAGDHPWSSAAFHLGVRPDRLIRSESEWGGPVANWREVLDDVEDDGVVRMLRDRTRRGFPCGDDAFVARVCDLLGRSRSLRPRGRPRKA